MEPKCTCGADSNSLISKRHFINNDSRYVKIIYCSNCGKIHGIIEDKNIEKILEQKLKK